MRPTLGVGAISAGGSRRSCTLRCYASADFVEEVHHQRYMTLILARLRTLRRHQYDEMLAVGGEIEVQGQPCVGKLFSEPYMWLLRRERPPVHGVMHRHDSMVFGA